jgi:hypothetical protein
VVGRIGDDHPLACGRTSRGKLIDQRGHDLRGVVPAHGDDVAPPWGQVGEHRKVVVELVRHGTCLLDERGADGAFGQIQKHLTATQLDHPG